MLKTAEQTIPVDFNEFTERWALRTFSIWAGKSEQWLGLAAGPICYPFTVDLNDGAGGFEADARFLSTGIRQRSEVLCLPQDMDGDGDIDLLLEWGHYGTPASNSRLYLNDGNMHYDDATRQAGLTPTGMSVKGVGGVGQGDYQNERHHEEAARHSQTLAEFHSH